MTSCRDCRSTCSSAANISRASTCGRRRCRSWRIPSRRRAWCSLSSCVRGTRRGAFTRVRDHRRRASLACRADRRAARDSCRGAPRGRRSRHRDGADREYPARGPESSREARALERLISEFEMTQRRLRRLSAARARLCRICCDAGARRRGEDAGGTARARDGQRARCSGSKRSGSRRRSRRWSPRRSCRCAKPKRSSSGSPRSLRRRPRSARRASIRTSASWKASLSDKLGAKVAVQHTASGKGKLVISYHSLDELDGILEHIR